MPLYRTRPWPPLVAWLLPALLLAGCGSLPASAQTESPTVLAERDPVLGLYLTDPDGRTLYAHIDETAQDLICRGACLSDWQPYVLRRGDPVAPPDLPGTLGILVRQGNQRQVTYDGAPLYYWKDDRRRGDARGNGREDTWFAKNVGPVLRVSVHPTLGEILVGPDGMTLYTFDKDAGDDYACEEGCAENFPPLVVTKEVKVPPGLEGRADVLERFEDDLHPRRKQVKYRGRPLYYFARDQRPGDALGEGIAGFWRVARP